MSGDAKRMIKLMGIPVIEALSEAESQCVALVKAKKADAVASEDLDCLTFGAPMQIKGFTQRREKKDPVTELELDNVLKGLDLTMDEFIDFCILCGCDYVTSIHGLGPSGAFKLIKEHKTIEKALEVMRKDNEEKIKEDKKPKYEIPPESQFNYTAARAEFKACRALEIESSAVRDKLTQIEFGEPDEEGLKKFLCEEKQFSNARVESGLNKIKAAKKSGVQSSLESFFGKPTIIRSQQEKTKSGKKGAQKTKDKDGIKFSTKR
jgi:flap endonuclease-1